MLRHDLSRSFREASQLQNVHSIIEKQFLLKTDACHAEVRSITGMIKRKKNFNATSMSVMLRHDLSRSFREASL